MAERILSTKKYTIKINISRKGIRRGDPITHGHSMRAGKSPEYTAWDHMCSRCYNKNDNRYSDYGARGITVCDRWLQSFENFLADMGLRPSRLYSIDRKDNNGNYEPDNCRWADPKTQRGNQRKENKACLECGTVTIIESKAKYCSKKCRKRAQYRMECVRNGWPEPKYIYDV